MSNILISQPTPQNGSPYTELVTKYGVNIDFNPLFRVEPLNAKEFRAQKINILDYTAIVFTAKSTIDAFFKICEELRVAIPDTMKYFCNSEAIALYLQKHIVYRKRKIFFGKGTLSSIIDLIGNKHKDEKFLLATTENVKGDLYKIFSKTKFTFNAASFIKSQLCDLKELNIAKYQILVFYSPLDIKSLMESFPEYKQGETLIATFGPATTKAAQDAGLTVNIMAPTPQAPSIAKALLLYYEGK